MTTRHSGSAGGLSRRAAQLLRRWMPPGLWEGPADRPWMALTFDDAPHPEVTRRALDTLSELEAPATFFVIGSRAERHPDLVRRMHADGHDVGNHTWSHRPLCGVASVLDAELARTEALLARLAPGSPRIFRPPFGCIGPGGPAALRRAGLLPVYWSVVPRDWDPIPVETVLRRVTEAARPGAVVVLHCGHPRHAGTVALDPIIRALRERGFELVTVRRMLEALGQPVGVR